MELVGGKWESVEVHFAGMFYSAGARLRVWCSCCEALLEKPGLFCSFAASGYVLRQMSFLSGLVGV